MTMKRTLLLVDDEADGLEPVAILLEKDYHVLTADCGAAALEVLAGAGTVDMIIADQRMPGMTGVELLARVREQYPAMVRLILTAFTDFDAMLAAINEGQVYRYIIKPWDPEDMRLTIRQALEFKDLRDKKGQLAAEIAEANSILAQRNRELEQAQATMLRQEKLVAVGRFAAEMVHEINNHLTIIIGANDLLVDWRRKDLAVLEGLESQARTLSAIVADIRDFSLGAALPFSPVVTDPVRPVNEVLRAVSFHPAFVNLSVRLVADAPPSWALDPRQLKHLLLNLLKNAAQASANGDELVVEVKGGGDSLLIQVIDHGIGIPAADREKIWEPFFTTGNGESTGLGLSICQRIASDHGGTITCEETPGGGTTFTILIPRSDPSEAAPA